jgi:thymidylate kinase
MMHALRNDRRATLVSFSGIDGSGKSTQIEALCLRLKERGLRVLLVRFWDDVAMLTRIRERTGHTIFKGDKGVGSPLRPISRRDKNVRSPYMTCVRLFLYFIDALSVRVAVDKASSSGAEVVIFDRYAYDELVNLTLSNPVIRAYVRTIMRIVPRPDISYLLEADPAKARARKPEYPLEFLHSNQQSYLTLSDIVGGMTVIAPMEIEDVKRAVFMHTQKKMSLATVQP